MDDGGVFFWIFIALVGVVTLGGGLALALVRDELDEERRAASEQATRELYAEEAREARR